MVQKINFDEVIKENIKEHNPNWPEIPDYPYRILIVGGSEYSATRILITFIYMLKSLMKQNINF